MKINQLKVGAILSYLSLFLGIFIALIYTPFMLRKLGQAEYGLLSLVNAVVVNLYVLDFGFGNAIIRYTSKYKAENNLEKEKQLHFMFLVLYSIIGIVSLIIGLVVISKLDSIFSKSLTLEEINKARVLMILGVVNLSLTFPLSIFRAAIIAHQKYIFQSAIDLIKLLLTPCVMVIILVGGLKAIGIMAATVTIAFIFNLFNVIYYYKVLKKKIVVTKFDTVVLKEIGGYSFFIFLNIIIDRLYWATDQIIIGIYLGAASVSVYTIGAQLFGYYQQISTTLSSMFLPRIVEMDTQSNSNQLLSELFVRVGRIQLLILTFIYSGFLIFGKEFITTWAGESFAEAYYIVVIVMFSALVPLSQNIGIGIIQAKKMHAFRSISYLFIAIFNVILSLILVRRFGIIGCAVATGIASIIGQGVIMNYYYHYKVKIDIKGYWINIAKISVPTIIVTAINMYINQWFPTTTFIPLFVKIGFFSIEYITIMWFVTVNDYEKNLVMEPLKNVLKRVRDKYIT